MPLFRAYRWWPYPRICRTSVLGQAPLKLIVVLATSMQPRSEHLQWVSALAPCAFVPIQLDEIQFNVTSIHEHWVREAAAFWPMGQSIDCEDLEPQSIDVPSCCAVKSTSSNTKTSALPPSVQFQWFWEASIFSSPWYWSSKLEVNSAFAQAIAN